MKTQTIRGGVALLTLALVLSLFTPIEVLSQTLLSATPTAGISSLLLTPEIPGASKLPITVKPTDRSKTQAPYPDLCAGASVSANCTTTVTFELSCQACVRFWVNTEAKNCCNPPANCCFLMVDCGDTPQGGHTLIRHEWNCLRPTVPFRACLSPGVYTLSLDVCDCVAIDVSIDPQEQCGQNCAGVTCQ